MESELERALAHMRKLTAIGIAMSAERNVQKILDLIVEGAMELTHADGATLYLVTPDRQALRFEIVLNRTLGTDLRGRNRDLQWPDVPLTRGGEPNRSHVSAYAATSKECVNLPDVYRVEHFDFSGMRKYDQDHHYTCKSMLVVPMQDHEDRVTGVLQLINALPAEGGEPIAFTVPQQEIVRSLASQAAVALNNARLIEALNTLFDSLIGAVASAIDAKSPYTGGHVKRVTGLAMDIALAINATQAGRYADVVFDVHQLKEIRTAAWLHDFGKVATPEVLVDKHTKLEKVVDRAELVALRFDVAAARAQLAAAVDALRPIEPQLAAAIEMGDVPAVRELEADKAFTLQWNDGARGPSAEQAARLERIARERGLITPDELENLRIPRGTLTEPERRKIEEHAAVTRRTLQELQFPPSLANVPAFAGGHHEMLDGSGYPQGLKADRIPLQTRILAVADIFEALTAERPYKKAIPAEKSLAIMDAMAREGKLDGDVIRVAVEAGVFRAYAEREMRPPAPTP